MGPYLMHVDERTGSVAIIGPANTLLSLGAGVAAGYAVYRYVGFAYIPIPIIVGIVTTVFVSLWLDPGQGLP
jgi:hypothetical protein